MESDYVFGGYEADPRNGRAWLPRGKLVDAEKVTADFKT